MAQTRVLISEVLILITNNMSHANIEKRLFFDVFFITSLFLNRSYSIWKLLFENRYGQGSCTIKVVLEANSRCLKIETT